MHGQEAIAHKKATHTQVVTLPVLQYEGGLRQQVWALLTQEVRY